LIKQGDVYKVSVLDEQGKKRKLIHPQIVIQDTVINSSRIPTIVVCGLTSNMKKLKDPGNVLLNKGEANLEKDSIVVVSQISLAQKEDFVEYLGSLDKERIEQIFDGMRFIQSF
jgi:mRNA interferase MazF